MTRAGSVLTAALVLLASAMAPAQTPEAHLAITSMTDSLPLSGPVERNPPTPTPLVHVFVVTNHGPAAVTNAPVTDVASPVGDFGSYWSCAASPGSSCGSPSGSGPFLSTSVSLSSGGTATFTVYVYFEVFPGLLVSAARVEAPGGTVDPNGADNLRSLWSYNLPAIAPTHFYAATPCRLVDTRSFPGPLRAGERRDYQAVGQCSIPAEARALVVNVTAAGPTDVGNLRLYPRGRWSSSSAINFAAGRTRANFAVVRLGQEGFGVHADLFPRSLGQTHLVVDVYGWFR